MLKFIKHHMETITGIEIYPLLSFCLFFAFFLIMTIWVIKADKEHIDEVANLPIK